MKIKKGDNIKIIAGREVGKLGTVKEVKDNGFVVVEGMNMVKRHQKASKGVAATIVEKEAPLHHSNIMIVCDKCKQPVRIRIKRIDGKKRRMCKRCDEEL